MSEVAPSSRRSRPLAFLANLLTVVAVFAIGLAGGWLAASQGGASSGHGHGEEDEGHEGHGQGAAAKPKISPRTLANLGVDVREAQPEPFTRSREIPAVVVLPPDARRPVYAPVAGVVTRVPVAVGQRVAAGAPVVEILRDPWPRPAFLLTESVLAGLPEGYGRSVAELRSAARAAAIAREELQRVRSLTTASGGGPIAGKVAIDLSYEARKAEGALENARAEAARHGLSEEEAAAVEAGRDAPATADPRRVLRRNHLWSDLADEVLALLPPDVRATPYTVAVLGELVGASLLTRELVDALKARPALAASFLDVAGLLQTGFSVPGLLALEVAGGLRPTVALVAPGGAPDYDVEEVSVREGARVERGATAVTLLDQRVVHLRVAPSGAEVEALSAALVARTPLSAEPLVPGAGPGLQGITLHRLTPAEEGAAHGAALAEAANERLCAPGSDGDACRTWRLRPGVRYVVRLPLETHANVFVFPADALVERGADWVVLLEDGDSFRAIPVRVLHHDSREAVVANDGAVFPGDRVVAKGAYALSLALQAAAGGGGGGHHGHHH